MPKNPVYCALDVQTVDDARRFLDDIAPYIGGMKLGLEFFCANGPDKVKLLKDDYKLPLFLDLKLHDIPNTVKKSILSLKDLQPEFLTIHAAGGAEMCGYASEVAASCNIKLLAVSVLTSFGKNDLEDIGVDHNVERQVLKLAKLALGKGVAGLVCSAFEITSLRQAFGQNPILMVPGIRPKGSFAQDQKRICPPDEALSLGANFLVIGRPITQAACPKDAAKQIMQELQDENRC